MKTAVKSNKTHGRFWSLLKQLQNYDDSFKDELKENICLEYSGKRTASLSELYNKFPADYEQMIADLKRATQNTPQAKSGYDREGDLWRKRCIAAVCSWLDRQGLVLEPKQKVSYAIGVITRASNCRDFNKIPVSRLTEIYSHFIKRNEVDPTAADTVILELEAEQFLQYIKNKHFNTK